MKTKTTLIFWMLIWLFSTASGRLAALPPVALPPAAKPRTTPCKLRLPDSGAWRVQINDSSFTVKSRVSVQVPCGRFYLRLFRPNERHWRRFIFADSVTFSPSDSALLQLAPMRPPFLPHPYPVARLDLSSVQQKREGFFPGNMRKPALIITAVAANWLSFYLKRRADDYYNAYRKSDNLGDIHRYYAASADFDRYSAIALGVSAAALSVFLYYLISE